MPVGYRSLARCSANARRSSRSPNARWQAYLLSGVGVDGLMGTWGQVLLEGASAIVIEAIQQDKVILAPFGNLT
ncbi:hypothetical protein CMV_017665 [Castanea mollissima]|uniref:Uncharacterized protein n=1 Tax=Castanea mollissima TaxID=60419 RepID=A0A8J4VQE3_9ROSI|nr:hypothetical protein CMV_017665 [Castanea mollissima]